MKLAAMIIILISFTSAGAVSSLRLRIRYKEMSEIADCIVKLCNEIRYTRAPYMDAVKKLFTDNGGFLGALASTDTEKKDFYAKVKKQISPSLCLKDEDWNVLDAFFNDVSDYYLSSQSELFERTVSNVYAARDAAKERYMRYGKLYAVSGLMAGLFAVIILA